MGSEQSKLLLIGLDNSGKTTILSKILYPNFKNNDITPTIGFEKQKFSRNSVNFQVLDMSGQAKYRDLWKSNATNLGSDQKIQGIIFVIDSTNKMRINVARSQLQIILQNIQIPSSLPYLFYANKFDMKDAIPIQQIEEIMQLKLINRKYKIFSCSALTGQGIQEGLSWFTMEIKNILLQRAR